MTMPGIRGHMGSFKVFQDGVEKLFDKITNLQIQMDSSMSRSFHVGNAVGVGDQSIDGWSGSFDMEVSDDEADKFIDALITNQLNGIGVSDYSFLASESYPNGTRSDYVYFDCQFSLSKTNPGQNEKITKSITFQASGRLRV